jgi:multidrug efflux pump subunit AcrB
VVLLFLANYRATLITLTAIPLSLVTAVLALHSFGASINTMTLGGMAIAIGALVDDAVIDVENVFRRLRENQHAPREARRPICRWSSAASVEIRSSIVFATLIIALVFIPIFFLAGVEGGCCVPWGGLSRRLAASLIVAVTVTPVLCYFLLPKSRGVGRARTAVRPMAEGPIRSNSGIGVESARRWVVFPAVVALARPGISTHAAGPRLPAGVQRGFADHQCRNPPGDVPGGIRRPGPRRGERTNELSRSGFRGPPHRPRRTGRARPGRGIGRTGRLHGHEGPYQVGVPGGLARRVQSDPRRQYHHRAAHLPPHRPHALRHAGEHRGENLRPRPLPLRTLAEQARQAMQGVSGVVDFSVEQQTEVPVLKVRFDREAIARHALTLREVARTLEAALQGVKVSRVLEGQSSYDLVVRLVDAGDWRLETLGSLLVDTPSGARVPLGSLASIRRETGPNQILREQVERKIVVQCNVSGRDVTGVVRDIQRLVDPLLARRAITGSNTRDNSRAPRRPAAP